MLESIFLAVVQAATEFLPISSSGHLALFSNLISKPDIFFFTMLHIASLLAIIIFTRKEIIHLITFDKKYRKMWIYLVAATIPAMLFGFLFKEWIERFFSSLLFIGCAFIFTGIILFFTKFTKVYSKLNIKNSILIGLFQILALLPGVSRSGMTISSALFCGIEKEEATKFSFLLFIPLSIAAFISEANGGFYFNLPLVISFVLCFIFSLAFLNILFFLVKKDKFWLFSLYCFIVGALSLCLGI